MDGAAAPAVSADREHLMLVKALPFLADLQKTASYEINKDIASVGRFLSRQLRQVLQLAQQPAQKLSVANVSASVRLTRSGKLMKIVATSKGHPQFSTVLESAWASVSRDLAEVGEFLDGEARNVRDEMLCVALRFVADSRVDKAKQRVDSWRLELQLEGKSNCAGKEPGRCRHVSCSARNSGLQDDLQRFGFTR